MDGEGTIQNIVSRDYPLEFPQPGWSQQNPEDWKKAVLEGVPELLRGFDASQVAGIGGGGQMHGLVVLDKDDNVIRPAILWNDGRTAKQVDYLNNAVGKEKLSGLTANIAFAGFTAPKILWMRENEPDLFARIARIMLQGLHQLHPHRRPLHRLLRRQRHAAAGRGAQALVKRDAGHLRHYRGSDAQAA